MKRKRWLIGILIISLLLNAYGAGKTYWDSLFVPNEKDIAILGEMTQMVISSKEYKKIAKYEKIYSIIPGVNRLDGGVYPYYYDIIVSTNKEAYLFSCENKKCSKVEKYGEMYSDYSEDEPVLPLKK